LGCAAVNKEKERNGKRTWSGIYELQEGWSEPRKVADPGFDTSAITDNITAISPDSRYLVFEPHFLLDTATGEITSLPVPGVVDANPDYSVLGVFSPDGHRLAYLLHRPDAVFVMELGSNEAKLLHRSACAEYYGGGQVCEALDTPSWLDSNTLVFAHHDGLPGSYTVGSENDPRVYDHIIVMTWRGDVILSTESPHRYRYRAIGETVFRFHRGGFVDAWLDGVDLLNGIYEPHGFCGPTEPCTLDPMLAIPSPDGHQILVQDDAQWHLIEVQTGRKTIAGTLKMSWRCIDPLNPFSTHECLWSPDETRVACLASDAEIHQYKLVVIPLSNEPGGVVLAEDYDSINQWRLLSWLP